MYRSFPPPICKLNENWIGFRTQELTFLTFFKRHNQKAIHGKNLGDMNKLQ